MVTPGWSPEMLVGVKELDEAHRAFLSALTELNTMDDAAFQRTFPSLVARVEADFRLEELLMEDMDYLGIKSHREQHARVLGALHHVMPRVEEGDIELGRKAAELLPIWFFMHMETMDMVVAVVKDCRESAAIVEEP